MTFAAPAASYDRYMGRYSRRLAPRFADFAAVASDMRALDVGCAPARSRKCLAERLGPERVAASDPSAPFVAACAARVPGADVRRGGAEEIPWPEGSFDAVLAQLVLNFIDDPPRGVREMRRVTRRGGVVAACTWDYAGGMEMLTTFWSAALALDPAAPAEDRRMRSCDPDELRRLWLDAGLAAVSTDGLEVVEPYESFDDYWDPFTAGVGPGGAYCTSLPPSAQRELREECRRRLGDPTGAFELRARAWAVSGRAR